MLIEVSNGEVIDKISILELKCLYIIDIEKLEHVRKEHKYLLDTIIQNLDFDFNSQLYKDLYNINKELWDIEDKIRIKEKNKEFDNEFIQLARLVYITNDRRARVKNDINKITKSNFVEQKSYEKY
jgi:hypothetical protein